MMAVINVDGQSSVVDGWSLQRIYMYQRISNGSYMSYVLGQVFAQSSSKQTISVSQDFLAIAGGKSDGGRVQIITTKTRGIT